jgi:hypothetical protein
MNSNANPVIDSNPDHPEPHFVGAIPAREGFQHKLRGLPYDGRLENEQEFHVI